ncbi:hypothetical protein [Nannocystis pusilla]|uniref:hypothetical protein n=1 Tax=Nannocystis pusilla TaxID=889268 RepID=UPI003BF326C0
MTHQRTSTLALTFSLLAAACSSTSAGTDSDGTGTATETSATDTDGDTSTTTTTEASSTPTSTSTSTSTGDSETDPDPTAATAVDSETDSDSTTGEPDPCAEWVVPEPANKFHPTAFIRHVPAESRYVFDFHAFDPDNSVEVTVELGAEEPVVGAQSLAFTAVAYLDVQPIYLDGTATIEIAELSEECFSARISDIVEPQDNGILAEQLPGGVVGRRVTQ